MYDSRYRQRVADFRARLTALSGTERSRSARVFIDTTGARSRAAPSRSDLERLSIYGRRRLQSIARVMALFELLREHEQIDRRDKPVSVEATGAYWQAFKGTNQSPACHTCPALLLLDGQLPTLITQSQALRRHIIVEFGDCMLMPESINKIDRILDDHAGWLAFEEAARAVLNDARVSWPEAVAKYREGMRDLFPEMIAILQRDIRFQDTETQHQFESLQAFYEGLFLTAPNQNEIRNLVADVRAELKLESRRFGR